MRRKPWSQAAKLVFATLATLSVLPATSAHAQESDKELVTALRAEHIPLAKGIEAAAASGKPISAKYEYEHGKLQLSVYTAKAGEYFEIIVDHRTGKVSTVKKITEGEDLEKAKVQSAAATKAKASLASAIAKAITANKGYAVVSATAALKGERPVAEITLLKGTAFRKVSESLE